MRDSKLYVSLKKEYEVKIKLNVSADFQQSLEKETTFKITKPASTQAVIQIANQPPKFQVEIPKDIEVDFIIGEDGKPEDLSTFEVRSPIAMDPEGGVIDMQFDNNNSPFISFINNNDDTATLIVDRSLVTKKSERKTPVKVTLIDEKKS